MSQCINLGDKVTFASTYKKELYASEDYKICLFTSSSLDAFPDFMRDKAENGTVSFTGRGKTLAPDYNDQVVNLTGTWRRDKQNRPTLFVEICIPTIPESEKEVKYFLQNQVRGVGKKLAEEVYKWCDGDLSKISSETDNLAASVKGLSERKARLLATKIQECSAQCSLSEMLNEVADPAVVRKLVYAYGKDAVDVVSTRPYEAAKLIGFEQADKIALANNFSPRCKERIDAAIECSVALCKTRQCAIIAELGTIRSYANKFCDMNVARGTVKPDDISEGLRRLKDKDIIATAKFAGKWYLYLKDDWSMERSLADRILKLSKVKISEEDAAKYSGAFDKWRDAHPDIHLHEKQSQAVYGATNLLSVVTGGPGTGKTTVLKAIMETYRILYPSSPITLMAPTGLAAKRMTESCERKAQTIHKALGLIPADNASGFTESDKTIPGGLVIVDEVSMVGIHLANFLLNAVEITPDTRIVFVGDVDQLPPVSPGTFLRDLINCDKVHVTRLTKNFRQAGGSNIADVAVKINAGDAKHISFGKDCVFTKADTESEILDTVIEEWKESVKEFGLNQTYVITPTHLSLTDPLSSNSLNNTLQNVINPEKEGTVQAKVGNICFRVGDRVINKKNTEEVINGEIGYITKIIPEDIGVTIEVDFSGSVVQFPPEKLRQLELAYAITVHSSQGCEFKSVITPISRTHERMLTRNLVYTAITRAKSKMHLIGDTDEFYASALNVRTSGLSDLLKDRVKAG